MKRAIPSRQSPAVNTPKGAVAPELLSTALWDALPIGICLLDDGNAILYVNRESARLLGGSAQACVGKK